MTTLVYNLLHEIVDRHCNPGPMTELKHIKCQLVRFYNTAENIDVDDILRCRPVIRAQYAHIMDTWRKIHYVIDPITPHTPLNELEVALQRCNALLATLPSWQPK